MSETSDLPPDTEYGEIDLKRLTKDLRDGAATLSTGEARFLVDLFYQLQEHRISTDNQVRSLTANAEPHATIAFFASNMHTLERQVSRALDAYSGGDPLGGWARSVKGIGPILAAGLLAHIDVARAQTVSSVWRFAGLDPTNAWLGKEGAKEIVSREWDEKRTADENLTAIAVKLTRRAESLLESARRRGKDKASGNVTRQTATNALARRPWNATLKTLCWKIGESFVKVSGDEGSFYGAVYVAKKAEEATRNAAGMFQPQAEAALVAKTYRGETKARTAYESGTLPPAHLHARAKRYAVKLFLSHYWQKGRELKGLPVPDPYPIAQLGHAHFIKPQD